MRVAVGRLEGVAEVSVSLNEGLARVAFEPVNEVTLEQLRRAIRDQGFSPREAVLTLTADIERRDGEMVAVLPGSRAAFTLTGDVRTLAELARATGGLARLLGVVASDDRDGDTPASLDVWRVLRSDEGNGEP